MCKYRPSVFNICLLLFFPCLLRKSEVLTIFLMPVLFLVTQFGVFFSNYSFISIFSLLLLSYILHNAAPRDALLFRCFVRWNWPLKSKSLNQPKSRYLVDSNVLFCPKFLILTSWYIEFTGIIFSWHPTVTELMCLRALTLNLSYLISKDIIFKTFDDQHYLPCDQPAKLDTCLPWEITWNLVKPWPTRLFIVS